MTSQRQIEANRRNATNSTGPRTTRGKAVVALNAVQHGLLSRQAVIQGESEAELIELGKRLRSQLVPVGELELHIHRFEALTFPNTQRPPQLVVGNSGISLETDELAGKFETDLDGARVRGVAVDAFGYLDARPELGGRLVRAPRGNGRRDAGPVPVGCAGRTGLRCSSELARISHRQQVHRGSE